MEEKTINAIELTRKIRDEHARRLAGASHAQRIAFYRERAKRMQKRVNAFFPVVEEKAAYPLNAAAVREKRGTYKTKAEGKEKANKKK